MKKINCLLLSIIMVMSVLYPCRIVIAKEIERHNTELFCEAVAEINDTYNSDSQKLEFSEKETDENPNMNYTENRLIVQTKNEINDVDAVDSVFGLDYSILQYEDKQAMEQAYDELSEKGYTVEKDKRFFVTATDVDGNEVSETWGYESVGVDYSISNIENSNEIVVGVFDTGVDYTHEDLANRITDITINLSYTGDENDCMDDNGHGTAVAGIIAQSTPENVKIKPYKVIDEEGYATFSEVVAALEYILDEKDKPDILNMSIGGYNFDGTNTIETELVAQLVESGITVCIASGNDNLPAKYCTPADCETAITVGAYDTDYHICSFSNYGEEIDVAAPGKGICTLDLWSGEYTADFSGTSFACPFVSAACAYVLMQDSSLSPAEVKEKIENSAIDMGEDEEMYFGNGMLSIANLIDDKTEGVPSPTVTGGFYNDTQTVEFDVPADIQLVYTLDKSILSCTNGTVYTDPITIDNEMQLNYALIKGSKYASNISSQYYTVQYYADESDFEITDAGQIKAYNGDKNNIVVPDTINGIVPLIIGSSAFEGSNILSIVIPESIEILYPNCFTASDLKHIKADGVLEIKINCFSDCYNLRDEVMPNLQYARSYSFYSCSMLHKIDFGKSLIQYDSYTFQSSGLLSASFENLSMMGTRTSYYYAFAYTPLISCYIPNVNVLSDGYFACCSFLSELYAPDVKTMQRAVFWDCYYLTDFDTPNLEKICFNSLYRCYIDTFYAPKLVTITEEAGLMGVGRGSYIRVFDCPALTTAPSTYFFFDMFVEEIYLDSLETTRQHTFYNLPNLNILYLPNVNDFYSPTTRTDGLYPSMGPLEIVWIPKAQMKSYSITLNKTKLFFAPSTTYFNGFACEETNIVLSDKAVGVTINRTDDSTVNDTHPTVIAPKGSDAYDEAIAKGHRFIDSDTIAKGLGGEIRTRDSGLRLGFRLDESKLDFDYETYAEDIEYGFVYTYNEVSEDADIASQELKAGNDGTKIRNADNRAVDGDISWYNIVFVNIPADNYESLVSARAYIYIDGMYFYSDVVTRSFSGVANEILKDDEIDQNTKAEVLECLNKEV